MLPDPSRLKKRATNQTVLHGSIIKKFDQKVEPEAKALIQRDLTLDTCYLELENKLVNDPFYQQEQEFLVSNCRRETPFFRPSQVDFDQTAASHYITSALNLYNQKTFRVVRFFPDKEVPCLMDDTDSSEEGISVGVEDASSNSTDTNAPDGPASSILGHVGRKIMSISPIGFGRMILNAPGEYLRGVPEAESDVKVDEPEQLLTTQDSTEGLTHVAETPSTLSSAGSHTTSKASKKEEHTSSSPKAKRSIESLDKSGGNSQVPETPLDSGETSKLENLGGKPVRSKSAVVVTKEKYEMAPQSLSRSTPDRIRTILPQNLLKQLKNPQSLTKAESKLRIDPTFVSVYSKPRQEIDRNERRSFFSESLFSSLLENRYEITTHQESPVRQFWPNQNLQRISISIEEVIEPGGRQPLIVYLALYDRQLKSRRSEDFACLWKPQTPTKCGETAAKKCMFLVLPLEEALVLTVRVAAFQSEAMEEKSWEKSERKTKEEKKHKSEKTKIKNKPQPTTSTDSRARMSLPSESLSPERKPILIGAFFFPTTWKPSVEKKKIELFASKKGFDDSSVLEFVDELFKRKTRQSEGASVSLKIQAHGPKEHIHGVIDPSGYPLKPFSPNHFKSNENEHSRIIQQVQPFTNDEKSVFFHYVNNFYIYPTKLNNLKGKGPYQIIFQFKDSDKDLNEPGLTSFCGQPFEDKMVPQAKTFVNSSELYKPFFDEIKLALPAVLTPKHHLLMTIISFEKDKKGPKQEKSSVLGYAVLPLMKGERPTLTGREIPIVTLSQTDYLQNKEVDMEPEKHAKSLVVTTQLVSSVHCRLPPLQQISPIQGAKYFPLVLRDMLRFSACRVPQENTKKIMTTFFGTLQQAATLFSVETLFAFVPYLLDFERKEDSAPLHKWFLTITKEDKTFWESFHLGGFVFHTLVRAMALHLHDSNCTKQPHSERFDEEFQKGLLEMFVTILDHEHSSYALLGICLIELLALIDRGVVVFMIKEYLSLQIGANEAIIRINWFRAALQYPNFIPLNRPAKFDENTEFNDDYPDKLLEKHPLIGILLKEIMSSNSRVTPEDHGERQIRAQNICALRRLLGTHHEQFKDDPEKLATVLGMYFPFLSFIVSAAKSFWFGLLRREEQNKTIAQEYLSCFLFLMRYSDPKLISWWLKNSSHHDHQGLLKIFKACVKSFTKEAKADAKLTLNNDVSLCALDMVSLFASIHKSSFADIHDESAENFKKMFFLLMSLLQVNRNGETINAQICGVLHQLMDVGAKHIFRAREGEGIDYLVELIYELMSLCITGNDRLRITATSLLYKTLCGSYKASKQLTMIKTRCNIGVSKILGGSDLDQKFLAPSLEVIRQYGKKDEQMPPEWGEQLSQMVQHLINLAKQIHAAREMGQNCDSETLASLYHEISFGFSNSPALRLTWLDFLKNHHKEQNNFLEAAQVDMHVAAIMIGCLRACGELPFAPPYIDEMVRSIAPNAYKDLGPDNLVFENLTFENLKERLDSASDLFMQATFYELALEVKTLLGSLYRTSRNANLYANLKESLVEQSVVVDKLTDQPARLAPVYFRVGFYGVRWEPRLRRKEFIYKKQASFTLPSMKSSLETTFGARYGTDLHILLTNAAVDESSLDPSKFYIQLAGVFPYVSAEKASSHTTMYDQNFNINQFLFESAVHNDDMAQQSKKKTIFTTACSFPFVESRVEVIQVETITLTPLQNATELIRTQTGKLASILNQKNSSVDAINTVQQTLQGSVLPMVNPGPLKVCEIFLAPAAIAAESFGPNHTEDIGKLIEAMKDFISKCGFMIHLNDSLCGQVQDNKYGPFTRMIKEKGYIPLKNTVEKACDDAISALEELKLRKRRESALIMS